jgi:hypothetical protein
MGNGVGQAYSQEVIGLEHGRNILTFSANKKTRWLINVRQDGLGASLKIGMPMTDFQGFTGGNSLAGDFIPYRRQADFTINQLVFAQLVISGFASYN